MIARIALASLMALALGSAGSSQEKKKDEPRTGSVTGVITAKGANFIEVKADGEDKARKYFTGKDDAVLKVVKMAEVNSRVSLDWRFGEGFRITKIELLKKGDKKDDKKPDDKKEEARKGTVTGVVSAKGDNWIEVKADGEEKGRRYVPHFPGRAEGTDKTTLELMSKIAIGTRVKLDWLFEERPRVMKIEVLKKQDEATRDDKKEEARKGTVTGVVSAKGDNWIEVKADGEEKGRRYVPHWRGGAPADGGGPDKDMVASIKHTPLHARVKIDWEFEERARVIKIEVLKKNDGIVKEEPRSGSIAGEIKSKKEQGKNIVIEVLAPGEEKARPYFVQFDPKIKGPIPEVLKAVSEAKVGDKVVFTWEATGHGPAIVKFEVPKKTGDKK